MTESRTSRCPGCGLEMPASPGLGYDGYFNVSPECWSLFTEVLADEYGNAVLFGQVHQITVDTYALQHAGGPHPDKSVGVHACGLYMVFELGMKPPMAAPRMKEIADRIGAWPHLEPPEEKVPMTICDIAMSGSTMEQVENVRNWGASVWKSWARHHGTIAGLLKEHLGLERGAGETGDRH